MSTAVAVASRVLLGFSLALALALVNAWAQTPAAPPTDAQPQALGADPQEARSALRAQRQAQSQGLDAAEQACYARFFTTHCLTEVARSRRAMQAHIRQQEAALDAGDRQQRAQDARLRLQEKLQEQSEHLKEVDPLAAEQAQRDKRAQQEAKQREHLTKAAASGAPAPATVPLPPPAPPAQ